MESQRVEKLTRMLDDLNNTVDKKVVNKLDLDTCKRIVQRLSSFSPDCEECEKHFNELEANIVALIDKTETLEKDDFKQHNQLIADISSHLQDQHQLITDGYYMSIFMSIGMGVGLLFGLSVFDNVALGLPIGMCFGIAVGTVLDSDAKKKGRTL